MHSNSCEADQDIAPSETNSPISSSLGIVLMGRGIPVLGQLQKARDSSNRIELIFH
ncbi:hypothetical protein [Prochlorococcus marinus]|uniref:Uncharacterized protein n=1 Tax=Prochlorococcus marinus str. PAC1 TaxID=59924 RepID=A0A0A2CD10_PROMR|nr:hypothetical protein [Prochlorococcus marinus]KGG22449.1 hypothetical protein EV03_0119 [Prochlorococcus marinus str. PAC1]